MAKAKKSAVVTLERRRGKSAERRKDDRRQSEQPVEVERRQLQRREKVSRRRQIDPTTCEREYTPEEVEFMNAMDEYKRTSGRMFPTCSEVLEVIRGLGYAKAGGQAPPPPPEPAVDDDESRFDEGSGFRVQGSAS
ncbi:MAG TPA: hypothetical protein VJ783_16965 [Pirellulales bacterium]|nr:hypothetical protein [Pirellulales bacterium]